MLVLSIGAACTVFVGHCCCYVDTGHWTQCLLSKPALQTAAVDQSMSCQDLLWTASAIELRQLYGVQSHAYAHLCCQW
jgi:hypothetical protein